MTTHSDLWYCVYDPEEGFSGKRLFGYHFKMTLADGNFPVGSIWYQRRNSTLFVVGPVVLSPDDNSRAHQVLRPCPAAMEESLPSPVRKRIEWCRTKPPAPRGHRKIDPY